MKTIRTSAVVSTTNLFPPGKVPFVIIDSHSEVIAEVEKR